MTDDNQYRELWKAAVEAEERTAHGFDRAMVTLSAGALALSITFIQNIAPNAAHKEWLAFAWAGLLLSLLFILVSMVTSQAGLRRYREILERRWTDEPDSQDEMNWPAMITKWLNNVSMVSFIIGVACLAVFSFLNLT